MYTYLKHSLSRARVGSTGVYTIIYSLHILMRMEYQKLHQSEAPCHKTEVILGKLVFSTYSYLFC